MKIFFKCLIILICLMFYILWQIETLNLSYGNYIDASGKQFLNENQSVVNEYFTETIQGDYISDLIEYLNKWRLRLTTEKNLLKIYIDLLDDTHDLIVKEQETNKPFKITERPVALSTTLNCSNPAYSSFINTTTDKAELSNIIDVFIFGYELFILEIRLFELYDVVDEFIIFESNVTFKKLLKPLFFLQNIKRYSRFLDKITLITPFNITKFNKNGSVKTKININKDDIADEFENHFNYSNFNLNTYFKRDYDLEVKTRMLPLNLYKKYIREFNSNDIFIHGDVDEIPDSNIIKHFKHCNVHRHRYPFSIWSNFYMYSFKFLYRSDFPEASDPYSFTFPSILSWETILKHQSTRFTNANILPRSSGCHLNRFFRTFTIGIYKEMSQSDGMGITSAYFNMILNHTVYSPDNLKKIYSSAQIHKHFESRLKRVDDFRHKLFIPWIIISNKDVYHDYLEND